MGSLCFHPVRSGVTQSEMGGSREKIKNLMEKNAKWTQDVAVNKLKDTIEPKKQIYWQRTGRRLSEELVTGFSDARKKNFAVRNLTESELNFLLEYVCNS